MSPSASRGLRRRLRLREAALRLSPAREALVEGNGRDAVALTFDDGPDPVFTPGTLDVLAEHGAHATFFLVGKRVERHPDLVRRIVAEGHAVGSHTWSHRDGWTLSWRELLEDYRAGRRAVEAVVSRPARLFRPPKGYYTGPAAVAARAAGLQTWLWTIDSEDWRPGVAPKEIVGRAEGLAAGDVVLLHDGVELPLAPEAEDRSAMVAALPGLIALARERGLECVPLPGPSG